MGQISTRFLFLIVLISQYSCVAEKMQIVSVCEEGSRFQDTVKWEVFPEKEGVVDIYVSCSADEFNLSTPVVTAKISDRVALVPKLSDYRKYFMLVFDKRERVCVANRTVNLPGVSNFRDIGGYKTECGKIIRWGKIFRTGELSGIESKGKNRLNQLRIKTLVDLRDSIEKTVDPKAVRFSKVLPIPFQVPFGVEMKERLLDGKCKRNDAIIYMQDLFSSFTLDYDAQLTQLFDRLADERNYPFLIECETGNCRTGFVVALIMSALDIPEEAIFDDYLFSNSCVEICKQANYGNELPDSEQEALTVLMSAQKSFLQYAFEKIRQDNGSIDQYFTKKLNLSHQKREKIQQILLTR